MKLLEAQEPSRGRRRRQLALVTAAACLLVLVACGPAPSSRHSPTTTSAPSAATVPTTTLEAEQSVARSELLVLADLPLGWTQQGTVELGDNSGGTSPISSFDDTGLGGCLGVATPEPVKAAEATSPEFADNGVSLLVDNWADVYPTAAGAASDFPAVGNPKFPACFVQEFARETTDWIKAYFEQDVTVGTLSPSVRNLGSYGDQSGVLEIFTPLTFPDGTTQTEYVDFLFVREGRSLGTIILDNSDAPFPAAIEQSLAQTITAKMAHAST